MSPTSPQSSAPTESPPTTRRIVLVDDDEIVRLALHTAVTRAGWTVVGEATDGKVGVELTLSMRPDLVLMDLSMPVMSGIEATRKIRAEAPDVEVVVLTVTEDVTVFDALKAGASGYLLKGTPLTEIVASLEEAVEGGSPITPRIARMVLAEFSSRPEAPPAPPPMAVELSKRETEILGLLVDGRTAASIAEHLYISIHTVNAHVRSIYRKLEVTSRAQAVTRALRDRLL